jgi:tetraacyldisaccharide 4'-kinase
MWLAETLRNAGFKTAILSRGYGRSAKDTRVVEPGDGWETVGDEPVLMARKLAGIPVSVSSDRYAGGMKVIESGEVDLFILDDGFGHHALSKDLEIVVIDDLRRFGNHRMIPAGLLREPLRRLRDADIILVTKTTRRDPVFEKQLRKYGDYDVFWADYRPVHLVRIGNGTTDERDQSPQGPFLGFCGVADPGSFRRSLERMGIEILDLISFPDHYPFTASDVSVIMKKALKIGARAIVTTEKDAIRWPTTEGQLPLYVLAMHLVFLEGEKELLNAVLTLIRGECEQI